MLRKIVQIDEELCDGCGLCVPSCAEGAIQIIDDKAKLVSEVYCDGLGACLGDCPQGAITVIEREAEAFDDKAVEKHLATLDDGQPPSPSAPGPLPMAGGCPGSASRTLSPDPPPVSAPPASAGPAGSMLANWPVQIHLAPLQAPYFDGATLLVAADCVPFAYPRFHEEMLAGRTLLVGCPKLDDTDLYWRKLGTIIAQNDIKSVETAIMEVPCCSGLVGLLEQAIEASGKDLSLKVTVVGIRGNVIGRQKEARPGAGSAGAEAH